LKRNYHFVFVLLACLLAGCGQLGFNAATPTLAPTDTPQPTVTLSPTNTLEPTATFTEAPSLTPTIMPTIEPVLASANTSVTLRSGPSKGSDNVGGVYGNQIVKVIARNQNATWFYVIAPDAPGGTAWVLASAFALQGDLTQLPIAIFPEGSNTPLILPPLIYTVVGTPLPLNPPAPGAQTATLIDLAKVRVGPGLGYMEIGLLGKDTVVVVTGHIKSNNWLQIEYPSGLDGRGWVTNDLVKFDGDYASLLFYNSLATPIIDNGESVPADAAATDAPSAQETPVAVDTPIPATPTPNTPYGTTTGQINARSGPAASFEVYGLIDNDQRVYLLGQTLNGLWLQIEYPFVPSGVAWVSSKYIKLNSDITTLPYLTMTAARVLNHNLFERHIWR